MTTSVLFLIVVQKIVQWYTAGMNSMIIPYPHLDPVAFQIGAFGVHWYGLCYLISFFLIGIILKRHLSQVPPMTTEHLSDWMFYLMLGVIVGGRLGYIFFYHFSWWWEDPFFAFRLWEPGMSFHGGLIGVCLATLFFARRNGYAFLSLADFMVPQAPIGLFFGRIGNFINGELWGRPTEADWGMIFPYVDNQARHPTQLYEAFLEGIVLWVVLYWVARQRPQAGVVSGCFLVGYAACRFLVEFYREPDAHRGLIAFGWLTEGQLLCIPMALVGFWLCFRKRRRAV